MTDRFEKCILHIGTEKTGTTTLQAFLGENRDALAEKGFFVPRTLSPYSVLANHERLTTFALRDEKINDDLRQAAGVKSVDEVKQHRAKILSQLKAEVASSAVDNAKLLLSNEHCHSRLVEMDEVALLREMLEHFADNFQIIVYIRPQHELATSLHDQALKAGYFDIDILPSFGKKEWVVRRYFQYDDLVKRWSAIFGAENLTIRIFDRQQLLHQNIIYDFLDTIGISSNGLKVVADKNRSIGKTFQQALNAINRFAAHNPTSAPPILREKIINLLSISDAEAGMKPTRMDAEQFFHGFDAGNEYVRQTFFPEKAVLFEPDFSSFPVEKSPQPLDRDALIRALLYLLNSKS